MDTSTPRRSPTIVGGSPMNRVVQASSLPLNVERLLIKAALSREFRQRLMADRETAATEAGIDLLPEERALLSHISDETLDKTIDLVILPPLSRRRFLKRAAASVVLALAGSAVLFQCGCGGAAPDEPQSVYDKPGYYWANLADLRCFVYVPDVYQVRWMERIPTPLLLALPDAGQTSLEIANHWLALCSREGVILVVAEWAGLPAGELAARLPQLFQDADALWGHISAGARLLTGFGQGAALALQVGVRADSLLPRIAALAGLPEPGWAATLAAGAGTRVYLRLGKEDLNAGQYKAVVDALRAAGSEVSPHRVDGRLELAECPQKAAWRYIADDLAI